MFIISGAVHKKGVELFLAYHYLSDSLRYAGNRLTAPQYLSRNLLFGIDKAERSFDELKTTEGKIKELIDAYKNSYPSDSNRPHQIQTATNYLITKIREETLFNRRRTCRESATEWRDRLKQ